MLLYQGITVLQADCGWERELLAAGYASACDWESAEIAVVPADARHPLLQDVGRSVPAPACRRRRASPAAASAYCCGQKDGKCRPVA